LQKEKGIDGSMTVLLGGTYACWSRKCLNLSLALRIWSWRASVDEEWSRNRAHVGGLVLYEFPSHFSNQCCTWAFVANYLEYPHIKISSCYSRPSLSSPLHRFPHLESLPPMTGPPQPPLNRNSQQEWGWVFLSVGT
jgi:hypothetical protein